MAKVGLFYGGSAKGSTHKVAMLINSALGKSNVDIHNIADVKPKDIEKYQYLILGTSAWGIGDMHRDWEMFIDDLADMNFEGKKLALFGLGDQKLYPESFADGMGTIYCRLPDKSVVVGSWPLEGYEFYFSSAEKDGKFVGLAIDDDSQPELTEERVKKWADMLKKEFSLK
jgi:flavodoxin I